MNCFKKILNLLLALFFVVTVMVPITGVPIHKMASTLFLILSVVHTCVYRKRFLGKKIGLLAVILIAFLSGLFGMIFDQYPIILTMHRAISIASVFFVAIHLFVYHKRYDRKKQTAYEEK